MIVEPAKGATALAITKRRAWWFVCRPLRGLWSVFRAFTWGSRPRLYADIRFAGSITLKALANFSPGRGPHAGSPRGVEVFALKPWVTGIGNVLFATLKGLRW